MEFQNKHIIEELYQSNVVAEVESSEEYKELLHEYNKLFDSIESEELKEKLANIYEMKNKIYGRTDKDTFVLGFSMAVQLILESISFKI